MPGSIIRHSIAGGGFHILALKSDGAVWAWGTNDRGQLGGGTKLNHLTPVQVNGLDRTIAVATGRNHSLAIGRGWDLVGLGMEQPGAVM